MILHINIVVLNGLEYTKKAVQSIKSKYQYKLRIIDQDSSDDTVKWCRDNDIDCYTKKPKVSLSEAWNFGIAEALKDEECRYIFFPNNDVLFHEKTIDNLVEAKNKSGYVMVTGNNIAPQYSDVDFYNMIPPEERFEPITEWRQQGPDFSCPLVGRDFTKKVGWFDENFYPCFYEDNDMHLRIIRSKMIAKRIASAPYYHYGSVTAARESVTSAVAGNYFLRKWGAMPSACMDGDGYEKPFERDEINWWQGCEKYG